MRQTQDFLDRLAAQDAVLVTVQSCRGSVPRATDAWMAVFDDAVLGSVGGGHLEWQAIAEARTRLHGRAEPAALRYALGPSLGQCCGGEVYLRFERVQASQASALAQQLHALHPMREPVAIFGAGHVGTALARVLATLPLRLRWVDSRENAFATDLADQVDCELVDPAHAVVPDLAPGSRVLIMTHSHAIDFELVLACLQRQRAHGDLGSIGLIGSRTKWAAFSQRLQARGFTADEMAQVHCPIGLPGIVGKQPSVIAVSVAAQLLHEQRPRGAGPHSGASNCGF